jgi:hypothetical protein
MIIKTSHLRELEVIKLKMMQKSKPKMLTNDKIQERKVQLELEIYQMIFLKTEVRKMIKYKKLLINYTVTW